MPQPIGLKKRESAVYELLRDRLFLLDDLKNESRLFLNDPEEYDAKVMNKIEKHNPKKIIGTVYTICKKKMFRSEMEK